MVARTARDGVHGVDELDDLLPAADVVILAIPYGAETHHLVDGAFLAALADGALVVNVARGPVVDTDALLVELTAGRLRAALDVTDPEPLPPDHPLWTAPNVMITPHVGGDTSAFLPRAWRLLQQQLDRFAAGRRSRQRGPRWLTPELNEGLWAGAANGQTDFRGGASTRCGRFA